mmetsp:Transcript_30105/g.29354  ORF Transcript_30105/g.29354 Transcript_30105/m.29354 type:complete len:246 (-) Transcript_30105:1556-2293(-)
MVRLEECFIKNLDSETLDVGADLVDVAVEELEVLVLGEVLQHLLEAELHEELPPRELGLLIVLTQSGLLDLSHLSQIQIVRNLLAESVFGELDPSCGLDPDRVFITQVGVLERLQLSPLGAVLVKGVDPLELGEGRFPPFGVIGGQELLLGLIVESPGGSHQVDEGRCLLFDLRDLIDGAFIPMVAFLPAVGNGLSEPHSEGLLIRHVDLQHGVVLDEVVHLLHLLALLLELIFIVVIQTAVVVI